MTFEKNCRGLVSKSHLRFGLETKPLRSQKSEVRSQIGEPSDWRRTEVVFVTGIRATLQKHFADRDGVARPNFFDKYARIAIYFKIQSPHLPTRTTRTTFLLLCS